VKQRRYSRSRAAGAIAALLLIGGSLAQWSPVGAQTLPASPIQPGGTGLPSSAPGFQTGGNGFQGTGGNAFQNTGGNGFQSTGGNGFQSTGGVAAPNTLSDVGFGVSLPSMQAYYLQHGGLRTLGQPLSHDFQLLGRRFQIFERLVLEQRTDGSVQAFDLLGDALPLVHAAGASFPSDDPDMAAANPPLNSPTYQTQALAAIDAGALDAAAPDTWNDLPVNFGATFRGTVTCFDLPPSQACDDRQLLAGAVDVWGLPTSAPEFDPTNSDLVHLRFQRGIMQYSQSTGLTEAVPIGSWFKRVLIGTDLPDDLAADVVGSRYYAQYAPTLPLGVARTQDLPTTSLAAAFSASNSTISPSSNNVSATSVNPSAADAAATPVFAPALPTFTTASTPTALPVTSNASSSAVTPAASATVTGTPSVAASQMPTSAGISSASAIPAGPQGPDPCAGDEQIYFAPKKPYVGTDVLVAVTSATHHDVRTVRLTGPVKTGQVNERSGLNGWVWEWTVTPTMDGWYEFTFYTDGARPCSTSGFNSLPAFGATAVPSVTATAAPFATATPIPTATVAPTATPIPAPSMATTGAVDPASGACAGRLLRLSGENFGVTQAALNGNVLFAGTGAGGASVATILSWTNTSILLTVPAGATAGSYQIVVTTTSGASTAITYQVAAC
jgi:hypothetical protein